ncbi:unnamed protein product [Gadus morhua 'NCC']
MAGWEDIRWLRPPGGGGGGGPKKDHPSLLLLNPLSPLLAKQHPVPRTAIISLAQLISGTRKGTEGVCLWEGGGRVGWGWGESLWDGQPGRTLIVAYFITGKAT